MDTRRAKDEDRKKIVDLSSSISSDAFVIGVTAMKDRSRWICT